MSFSVSFAFKMTVLRLLENGLYPTAGRIQEARGLPFSSGLTVQEWHWWAGVFTAWAKENPDRQLVVSSVVSTEDIIAGLRKIEADLRPT